MNKSVRKNLYLRAKRDADLIKILEEAGVLEDSGGDFSYFVRGMMRDGEQFRQLVKSGFFNGNNEMLISNMLRTQEPLKPPTNEEKFGDNFNDTFKL